MDIISFIKGVPDLFKMARKSEDPYTEQNRLIEEHRKRRLAFLSSMPFRHKDSCTECSMKIPHKEHCLEFPGISFGMFKKPPVHPVDASKPDHAFAVFTSMDLHMWERHNQNPPAELIKFVKRYQSKQTQMSLKRPEGRSDQ